MTSTRPLLLGYIRANNSTTDDELAQSTSDLAAFAEDEGYSLSSVLVEWIDGRTSEAFDYLVDQMEEIGARALVMPGPILLACAPCR